MMRRLLALTLAIMFCQYGCYNTYNVPIKELAKAQEGGQTAAVQVKASTGELIPISKNTKIGVRDKQGGLLPISPFNFTAGRFDEKGNFTPDAQLIAPDEDLLISRNAIQSGYVKQVSSSKTILIVVLGLGAILGGGLAVALTAEEEKAFGAE